MWNHLPVTCLWKFQLDNEGCVLWSIDMKVEEFLDIDERRVVILIPPVYKTWINSHEEGRFPQIVGWQDMPLENFSSKFIGVRFSRDNLLPPLSLEFEDNQFGKTVPCIQNTSIEIGGHLVGVKLYDSLDKKAFKEGTYNFFSGKISICKDEQEMDYNIETHRKLLLSNMRKKVRIYKNKNIKVLLANMPWQMKDKYGVRAGSRWPHIKDESEGEYLPFPFFLAYSTALLRKHNINAELLDCIAERIPEDVFLDKLSRMKFDLLVSETSTPSFYYDMGLLKKISHNIDVPVVLCGSHPEIYKPEFLERHNFIDFVLFGEYEITLLELVRCVIEGKRDFSYIDGLIWRDEKNNVVKNRPRELFDLNILPWPYRDNLPMERYWDLPGNIPHPSAQMVASRGCPFSCNFCLWPQILFNGNTYRTRDVKDVVDEMEFLIREKEFKSIYFDDDTFNIGKTRMIRLCSEIIDRGLNNIPWAIMARADLMDKDILNAMKKAGLHAVKYGIESISQEIVTGCGKALDLKKTEDMINYTKSLGIYIHLTFSFGLSGETKETIRRTIDYALKLDPQSVQFSIITPFPGTRLFEQLDAKGKILTKNWSLYDGHYNCIFRPDNLSTNALESAKQYAYRRWAEHQRKKRGFRGDVKRFLEYYRNYGFGVVSRKTLSYLNYFLFKRKKFVGKI